MSDLGISIDGFTPARAIAAQAQAAEAGGARRLWLATHLFLRDPVTLAAAALAATRRLEIALMAISPYAMHPVHAAMAAATLDELHPGRVVLSLGVGAPGDLAAAGIATPRPARTLEEAIAICRALFAGEAVEHDGAVFRLGGRGLASGAHAIPIVLAATGPRMLALAGSRADGALISGAVSIPYMRRCLAQVKASAAGRDLTNCGLVYALSGPPGATLKRALGFILRGAHHAPNLAAAGVSLDQDALRAACSAEDWQTVERLISPDIIAGHAACGGDRAVRTRLEAYRDAGLDHIVLAGLGAPQEIARTLAVAA